MRILFCVTGLDRGGAEVQVTELAARLKERGHEVMIASMLEPAREWAVLSNAGIPVRSLGMQRGRASVSGLLRLVHLSREFETDIVHSHMVHANILARVARWFGLRGKLVCTAHNVHEGGAARMLMYALTDSWADLTTNVSEAAVRAFVAKGAAPASRITCIPNGIDPKPFATHRLRRAEIRHALGWRDGAFVWLAAGRLVEAKDYPNLFFALRRLRESTPLNWRVCIVGDGPLRGQLKHLLIEQGLEGVVEFLGTRDDVARLMAAADAFVLSSAWEGLPMVLLEASASGLPVVATTAGGNAEIVVDGRTGWLVPIRDSAALATAMTRAMAQTSEVRRRIGLEAQARIRECYSMDRILAAWEDIYKNLTARMEVW